MEWLSDPTIWLGLLTLITLEIVLGIDNLVFIAILADKLPPEQRDKARLIGLSLALIMRLGLLTSIAWIVTLTQPLISFGSVTFSGRDLIMLGGGLFLLFKATLELHERLEGGHATQGNNQQGYARFWPIVAQIIVLDAVFSLDAVITAVGMVDQLPVMMIAVIISMILMMLASKPLTQFVNAHPTVIVLCLGFLMMIGFTLTAEGMGYHIPKGYLYAAIGFSILVEAFNQWVRVKRQRSWQGKHTLRKRTAHAVLRLLGGKFETDEMGEEITDLVGSAAPERQLFDRRERLMIHSVLNMAEQSVQKIMVHRREVDFIKLDQPLEQQYQHLALSVHSRLPVIQQEHPDKPLGYVHKKELLRGLLSNQPVDLENLIRTPINLPNSISVLGALEQLRAASSHIAFVVNEFGDFEGLLTLTDILEGITGELPDASEIDGPDIEPDGQGGYRVNGAVNLALLRDRIAFSAAPTEDYQTLAGLTITLLDRLPVAGDQMDYAGWRLKVVQVQDRRATALHLHPIL